MKTERQIRMRVSVVENGYCAHFGAQDMDGLIGETFVARSTGELEDVIRKELLRRLDEIVSSLAADTDTHPH